MVKSAIPVPPNNSPQMDTDFLLVLTANYSLLSIFVFLLEPLNPRNLNYRKELKLTKIGMGFIIYEHNGKR